MSAQPPQRPTLDGLEDKWSAHWESAGTYRFHPPATRDEVYSIDTPPPTVSGSLHVGHVFSYTHTDLIARFQRMRGKRVCYPMGWDDNGLPTERRVQVYFGVRCDPSLPYDPDFVPPTDTKRPVAISRKNFVELCGELTELDERAFEGLWRRLGLSVDWSMLYTTIGERARRLSQIAFLRLWRAGEAYQAEAPTLWDVDFRTAVAQAELEDREHAGAWHRIAFQRTDGPAIEVETTRPELLPACVALIAHPADERYQALFGSTARSPVFHADIPVLPHPAADPERASGIAMCCTFGDLTDVQWWRELKLPTRTVLGRNGRLLAEAPAGIDPGPYTELAGATVTTARARVVELLREAGALLDGPRPTNRPVKFYEKGERPLEIVSSRQWFIRTLAHREALLSRGTELRWHPEYMRARYTDWVNGLNGDWLISRQRFNGVPFPLWYPLNEQSEPDYTRPIQPDERELPVDPTTDVPPGYTAADRDQPNGFTAEPDVLDSWATSALTPLLVCGWLDDPERFALTYPMDLRAQAHDIIRTWLFDTVLRAELHTGELPWRHVALSGWILDPDRKKMGKSTGNARTPTGLLDTFGADAVRHWAASGRPGTDTTFDEAQLKIGRRLATKLLHASKFVLSFTEPERATSEGAWLLDRAVFDELDAVINQATEAFENYEYTTALERIERFFWFFCDDYLELVKLRAYGQHEGTASALATLRGTLHALLRLFAPFLPYCTEEVWSWWQQGSVHLASWPTPGDGAKVREPGGAEAVLETAQLVLGAIRKSKSAAKVSMRAPVARVQVATSPAEGEILRQLDADIRAAGSVEVIDITATSAGAPQVTVELG
ncbi:valyl-tRNA synthetase [Tamaricihabitans halophyticus]|uniref:Valine--tRNA ligase n=1 Tax=Tamaricihabitans halophyticus TaxID=1262583 RepID=A0A4R2R485_9PSEU|nr:valine--tRNA ligase [Tamaricihabitans halophyticus]TCP56488.1 valyl-tRNA synthetase [Tamaricihabitans halophyticus]